jgi:hypothetical protein
MKTPKGDRRRLAAAAKAVVAAQAPRDAGSQGARHAAVHCRLARDGKLYGMDDFMLYYGPRWQGEWEQADCGMQHAASLDRQAAAASAELAEMEAYIMRLKAEEAGGLAAGPAPQCGIDHWFRGLNWAAPARGKDGHVPILAGNQLEDGRTGFCG